jgi:Rrf2 family transcriptional regulator, iron-sulfur cluster assembly transcription factor
MIYSRSAEYAIRSFAYLARVPSGKYAMARHIAEEERIPAHFLSKILQDLTRKGMLRSSKGPSGGFALRTPASQIRLLDLVEALDGRTLAESFNETPWVLDSWRDLHSRIMDYLERHTIADVARALEQKKAINEKSKRGRRAGPKKS